MSTAPPEPVVPVGIVVARLAEALADDLLYIASDEQRAEAVAAALRAAAPGAEVVHCPSSDALPGDSAPASPANVGRRVAALRRARLLQAKRGRPPLAFITTAEAAARGYAPPAAFDAAPPLLEVGQVIDLDALGETLAAIGYVADDRVDEPGEMAVRGQVIDLFPADALGPTRIDLADGVIAAMRGYDPVTQLGHAEIARLEIGRAVEPPPGADWQTLFDHLAVAAIALDGDATRRRDRFVALAADATRDRSTAEPVVDVARWDAALAGRRTINLAAGVESAVPRFVEAKAPFRAFARMAKAAIAEGAQLVLVGAARDLRFLAPRLAKATGVTFTSVGGWCAARAIGTAAMVEMPLDHGWQAPGLLVVAAADLLGSRALRESAPGGGANPFEMHGELRLGDTVVHEDFGIGRIAGLEPMVGKEAGDAIVLEYASEGRRLVAVGEADRIWRYGGEEEAITLDRLDGSSWEKRRGDINRAIAESARALTALAAERAARVATDLSPDPADYERFVAGFAFTETADQARAIAEVRADLVSGTPMDRLVVGDVGYGKTEVALRAAALAALSGKQAVIAAPTTVLVRQHLESFRRRFAASGIGVAALSRLSSAAEKAAVKAGLADGSIQVVVGTAAVAGKGMAYNNLALVVIDEEQRLGATDKAKIRALAPDAHILTLTATPIPRTLQMALVGLQQISVIATPPARRQPIRTSVLSFDEGVIRTALLREQGRGGQSFVVVPRIEDMAWMAETLARLAPDLVLRQAHGKMPADEIDEAMVRFADGDGDVLLATNIIEAGLDVPRANTMIVWRADRFGLAQLHQLRGRVGRGGRRGQILLTTEPGTAITAVTLKRLRTLQAFDRLGAGFAISARDLDLRGAGDLLGDAQAGHVKLIGVDLYQHLLEGALRSARGEAVDYWTPQLNLGGAGRLPDDYIPELELRLSLYGRLSRIVDAAGLDRFEAELEDRFGPLPAAAVRLVATARLGVSARGAGIARIDAGPSAIALTSRHAAADFTPLARKKDRWLLAERIDDVDARLSRLQALFDGWYDAAA